jgi:ABC-type transport system involved in multi-copper enzyme maturation permease subunit
MNGVWRSLLWKEWREQRWKTALLISLPLLLLPVPWVTGPDYFNNSLLVPLVLFGVPTICIFIGAGLGAGEQSQRTVGFLQALPIGMERAAIAKLIVGGATVFLPWVVTSAVVFVWDQRGVVNEVPPLILLLGLLMGVVSVSLVVWAAAASANLADEVRGGAVAFLTLFAPWAVIGILSHRLPSPVLSLLMSAAPGGIFAVASEASELQSVGLSAARLIYLLLLCATALTVNCAVTYSFVRRFGKALKAPARRTAVEAKPDRTTTLGPPRLSPWRAVLWRQFRETAPLALLGAATILCITLLVSVIVYRESEETLFGEFAAQLAVSVWAFAGIMISIVAGLGVFLDDLRPELNNFWRSRPINPTQSFFIRYFASLAMTLLALALPTGVVLLAVALNEDALRLFVRDGDVTLEFFVSVVLAQAAMFSVSMAAMIFIQRPVIAAIVASLVGAAGAVVAANDEAASALAIWLVIAALVAATVMAAWRAIRSDWRWAN